MKLLLVVNYYYPYISGLSEVVRLLAEGLASKGNQVTVLCSNHDHLTSEERINGVHVIRTPVLLKISKGTVSPSFIPKAIELAKSHDIVNLHVPMLESGIISSCIDKRKLIVTYHCDIDLEKGIINDFIKKTMLAMNHIALKKATKIMVTTKDYAMHSVLARDFPDKLIETHTPIKEYYPVNVSKPEGIYTIGFCGRIVMEKGIDILLQAYKILRSKRQDIRLWIGGDYKNVAGGSIYPKLKSYIEHEKLDNITFLGKIPEEKMAMFYSSLDVFCLPSVNPLEAFGMVQIEAMYCGTPVTASNLYGVRTIIQNTKMGIVHKAGDPEDLAACINTILDKKSDYIQPRKKIHSLYGTQNFLSTYINCCKEMKDANEKQNI